MELFLLLLGVGIFAETSYLTFKTRHQSKKVGTKRKVFVDTSALMDGRILAVAQTGFFSDNLIIPRSVVREMQLLADGKDSEKRTRARAGMDVASALERVVYFDTEIYDDSEFGRELVDERLLKLAKANHGVILTCDYNLQKVAATENVEVLNVNELAMVLGNTMQMGDKFQIEILEKGSNPNQGIGHLSDGTMVVVENGEKLIGKEAEVEFVRFLQTNAGRIVFAKSPKGKASQIRAAQKKNRH